MERDNLVEIYTDGSCRWNKNGGWACILIDRLRDHRKELYGFERNTTSNRMELMAAIQGLEALKASCVVSLYSDSQYLVNSIEKGWAYRWRSFDFVRHSFNDNKPVLNPDLWARLLKLCDSHSVKFHWVKGHNGHVENERCDYLAGKASIF